MNASRPTPHPRQSAAVQTDLPSIFVQTARQVAYAFGATARVFTARPYRACLLLLVTLMGSAVLWSATSVTPVHAAPITYTAVLNGASESPPNASAGTGSATVDFDEVAHTMRVRVTFSGLSGNTTAAHVHAATAVAGIGTAGVATQTPTFAGFPSGVTSGTYDLTFDTSQASSWNAAFITAHGGTVAGAEAFFAASLAAGTAYLNVHSTVFPGGEIRGFLAPEQTAVTLGELRAEPLSLIERLRDLLRIERAR
jgi:hypothetical protein